MWQAVNQTGSAEFSNRKGCGHIHASNLTATILFKPHAPKQTVRQILTPCASNSNFKSSS